MSVLSNSNAIATTGGAYNITDSLRFSSTSAYLDRTPSSAGTRTTWTFSAWIKRGDVSAATVNIFYSNYFSGTTAYGRLFFLNNALRWDDTVSNTLQYRLDTTQLFRDPSAWYHIVCVADTTNATASERLKIYVNGEKVTSLSTSTYPSQNYSGTFNNAVNHELGGSNVGTNSLRGYMTEVNFVDGQALTPSDFGETNADGVWSPKKYTGTYGTNGFYLPMKETTQATGFNTVLYTGSGASQDITGVGFSPDLVWHRNRTDASGGVITDTVRGNNAHLQTTNTNAEGTFGSMSFLNDGFNVYNNSNLENQSGKEYVAWCWDAGSSTVSNTDGTITSSVRANPDYGFSVVTYTGNGTAGATVGHGLGSTPAVMIVKNRSAVSNWVVYHHENTANPETDYLRLNTQNATADADSVWNDTAPTSSVFSIGTASGVNTSSSNYVAYCFSEVSGYSKMGSFTGNATAGNSVTGLGFKPGWIMFKNTNDSGESWYILDATRSVNNNRYHKINPDGTSAESTSTVNNIVDFDDDGFTIQSTNAALNGNGNNIIYMAFADTRNYQWNFDASGNKNNWTPNNINSNASSESTYDLMSDTPSLADEDTSNFATLNPNAVENVSGGGGTFSNANLTITAGAGGSDAIHPVASIGTYLIGKSYWEVTIDNAGNGGNQTTYISIGKLGGGGVHFAYDKNGYSYSIQDGWVASDLPTYTTGDVIGVAYDQSTSSTQATLKWYKNGTLVGTKTSNYTSHPKEELTASCRVQYNAKFSFNFGQRPFKYTIPTGYKKLNTFNLPDSDIKDGSNYFNTVLWTGNSSPDRAITGVGFQPDFVWLKTRSNSGQSHHLVDAVRGAGTDIVKTLFTNSTNAEATSGSDSGKDTYYGAIQSLDSDGFTVDKTGNDSYQQVNNSGWTYVAWNWKANGSGVSNTDGSITSTVSANTTSGFSVVTYTGNGANSTIGHGLNSAPKMIIVKSRSNAYYWNVYHTATGAGGFLPLNTTGGYSAVAAMWNNTAPTDSVFHVGTNVGANGSGSTYVAYCFAEVEGFSKFGTYTGNGSADGPFVYTGFRPAFFMIKRTSGVNSWQIIDNTREGYNPQNDMLFPDLSWAESNVTDQDILSNGFKFRTTGIGRNGNGETYIYIAFAENPFKNSLAR